MINFNNGYEQSYMAADGSVKPQDCYCLNKWAFCKDDILEGLVSLAREEKWNLGEVPENGYFKQKYPILLKYLKYTFTRLRHEDKVCYSSDQKFAAFNTGLSDKYFNYIIAIFTPNGMKDKQPWYLNGFAAFGEGNLGKILANSFRKQDLAPATYFRDNNLIFDVSRDFSSDYDHILLSRIYRLPVNFLSSVCLEPLGIDKSQFVYNRDLDPSHAQEKKTYFYWLGKKIKQNDKIYKNMRMEYDCALKLAKKRVERNFRIAVPAYYPAKNQESFLLPLCFVDEKQADVALVVSLTESGSYQAHTILLPDDAYASSKLITRGDSSWLESASILY